MTTKNQISINSNSFLKDRVIADKYLPVGNKLESIEEEYEEYQLTFNNGTLVQIGEIMLGDGYQVSIMNADEEDANRYDTDFEVPLYKVPFKTIKTAKNRFLKDISKK